MTPSWARTPRYGATEGGKIQAEASFPISDGPSRIPATTSPMTGGWPRRRNTQASARPVTTTAASAIRTCNSASDFCATGDVEVGPALQSAGGIASPAARIAKNTPTAAASIRPYAAAARHNWPPPTAGAGITPGAVLMTRLLVARGQSAAAAA